MSTDYDAIAPYYDPATHWFMRCPRTCLLEICKKNGIASILDIGCGTGALGVHAVVAGIRYLGMDVSLPMLRRGKKKLSAIKHASSLSALVRGTAEQLPFSGQQQFDAVVFSLVLHETDSPPEKLLATALHLASTVLILEWRPVERNLDYLLTFWRHGIERLAGKDHYRHFRSFLRQGGVRGLAERTGAKVELEIPLHCNSLALYLLRQD